MVSSPPSADPWAGLGRSARRDEQEGRDVPFSQNLRLYVGVLIIRALLYWGVYWALSSGNS